MPIERTLPFAPYLVRMLTHKLTRNSFIGKLSKSTTCDLTATARPTLPQTAKVVKPNRTAAISTTPAANRSAPAVGDQRPRPIRDPAEASSLQSGSKLLLRDKRKGTGMSSTRPVRARTREKTPAPHYTARPGTRLLRKDPSQKGPKVTEVRAPDPPVRVRARSREKRNP